MGAGLAAAGAPSPPMPAAAPSARARAVLAPRTQHGPGVPGQAWGGKPRAMARRCPPSTPECRGEQQRCPTSARDAAQPSQRAQGTSASLPPSGSCNVLAARFTPCPLLLAPPPCPPLLAPPPVPLGERPPPGVPAGSTTSRQGQPSAEAVSMPAWHRHWPTPAMRAHGSGGVGAIPTSQTLGKSSFGSSSAQAPGGGGGWGSATRTALPVPADLLRWRGEGNPPPQGCRTGGRRRGAGPQPLAGRSWPPGQLSPLTRRHGQEAAVRSLKPRSGRLGL